MGLPFKLDYPHEDARNKKPYNFCTSGINWAFKLDMPPKNLYIFHTSSLVSLQDKR